MAVKECYLSLSIVCGRCDEAPATKQTRTTDGAPWKYRCDKCASVEEELAFDRAYRNALRRYESALTGITTPDED